MLVLVLGVRVLVLVLGARVVVIVRRRAADRAVLGDNDFSGASTDAEALAAFAIVTPNLKNLVLALHAAGIGPSSCNTKGYSSTYPAMGFATVRAGTQKRRAVFGYPPGH